MLVHCSAQDMVCYHGVTTYGREEDRLIKSQHLQPSCTMPHHGFAHLVLTVYREENLGGEGVLDGDRGLHPVAHT